MNDKLLEAIDKRRSVRSYIDKSIKPESIKRINQIIDEVNEENSFRFELIIDSADVFSSFRKSYGFFKGVNNYIALVVNENDPNAMEKVGYYGERLILEVTTMDLGTCWVFGTFDKDSVLVSLKPEERLVGVITVGYNNEKFSFNEKISYNLVGARKVKPLEFYYESDSEVPPWFLNGVEAMSKAPSAINFRPTSMLYKNCRTTAKLTRKSKTPQTDLGIAKYHFVVGAGGGEFNWGDKGEYFNHES